MSKKRLSCIAISSIVVFIAIGLTPALYGGAPDTAQAGTPPNSIAVSKPADLPLRVPFENGKSYPFGAWGYNPANHNPGPDSSGNYVTDHVCHGTSAVNDCYALDFVNMGGFGSAKIFPAFGGTVRFAGCARGGWWHYGRAVYIEYVLHSHTYGAFYTHLASITDAVKIAASSKGTISINTQIGTAGDTVTTGTKNDDSDCNNHDQSMGVHLHFAIYQDATFNENSNGIGPSDGKAVVPEPFVGSSVYENFQWWHGNMIATDLATPAGNPTGSWNTDASSDGQTVPYGQSVR